MKFVNVSQRIFSSANLPQNFLEPIRIWHLILNSRYNRTYAKSENYAYGAAVGGVRNANRKCKAF